MIRWSLESAADLALDDDALPEGVLSESETRSLRRFRIPSRRRDWLLGRVTAKRLVRAWASGEHGVELPLDGIVVDKTSTGAPVVRIEAPQGSKLPTPSLSISHREGWALCAMSDEPGVVVGADLELVEPRKPRFVRDYFTREEVEQVRRAPALVRDTVVTAIWSGKEAVLKVLGLGLTVNTREVSCDLSEPGEDWADMNVECQDALLPGDPRALKGIEGWWRKVGPFVVTLAAGKLPPRN